MRRTRRLALGGVAAAGTAALVIGLTVPASAAGPTFGGLVVSGPASAVLPPHYAGRVDLKVRFDGPSGSGISYSVSQKSARPIARNAGIRASYVRPAPSIYGADRTNAIAPGVPKTFFIEPYGGAVADATTPGRYRATVTVAQIADGRKQTLTNETYAVTLNANVGYSKERTGRSGTPRAGKVFSVTVKAPYYQVGAKVTAFVKLKGKKVFAKTASGTLKTGTRSRSVATVKIPAKYVRSGAKYYFKVAAAPYAGGYTSAMYRIG